MKKVLFIFVFAIVAIINSNFVNAQVAINTTGASPDSSAVLDISGTTGGILIPRMITSQRNQIFSPASGLLIYNTDVQTFEYWNGTVWCKLAVDTDNEFVLPVIIDIPELDNGEYWQTSIYVSGLTPTSTVEITATCNLNDSNGNVMISLWIDVVNSTVWLRFTNQSHHKNDEVCGATFNLRVENP
ncbi:MAG: hypothetical protein WC603_03025 [Candidatus Paceibacterota bacterium]|jgi:hypothetical protein